MSQQEHVKQTRLPLKSLARKCLAHARQAPTQTWLVKGHHRPWLALTQPSQINNAQNRASENGGQGHRYRAPGMPLTIYTWFEKVVDFMYEQRVTFMIRLNRLGVYSKKKKVTWSDNSYITFSLFSNWQCKLRKTETVCAERANVANG